GLRISSEQPYVFMLQIAGKLRSPGKAAIIRERRFVPQTFIEALNVVSDRDLKAVGVGIDGRADFFPGKIIKFFDRIQHKHPIRSYSLQGRVTSSGEIIGPGNLNDMRSKALSYGNGAIG